LISFLVRVLEAAITGFALYSGVSNVYAAYICTTIVPEGKRLKRAEASFFARKNLASSWAEKERASAVAWRATLDQFGVEAVSSLFAKLMEFRPARADQVAALRCNLNDNSSMTLQII